MPQSRSDFWDWVSYFVAVPPAVCSFFTGLYVLGWQVWQCLKTADWPAVTPRDAIYWWAGQAVPSAKLETGLRGVDQVLTWCLDETSIAFWLIAILPLVWLRLNFFIADRLGD
jgi:hypothetical protein